MARNSRRSGNGQAPKRNRHQQARQRHGQAEARLYALDPPQRVGERGFSIFRTVPTEQLEEVFSAASCALSGMTRRIRNGLEKDHGPTVYQLEKFEVRQNAAMFGAVAVQPLLDDIYARVPSLRQPIKQATLSGVRILGPRKSTPVVALGFDNDTRDQLNEERQEIIQIVNDRVSAENGQAPKWKPRLTPHISIVRLPEPLDEPHFKNLVGSILEAAPEAVNLDRANFKR